MEHTCGKLQPMALAEMDPKYAKAVDDTKDKMMKNNGDTLMKKGLCFKCRSTDIGPMNALTMMIRMMIRHQNNNTCNKNSNPLDGCDSEPKLH